MAILRHGINAPTLRNEELFREWNGAISNDVFADQVFIHLATLTWYQQHLCMETPFRERLRLGAQTLHLMMRKLCRLCSGLKSAPTFPPPRDWKCMPYAFQNKLCAALPRGPSRRLWLCCNSSSWLWSSDLPRKKVTWITCLEQINFWHLLNSCSSKSIKKKS